MSYNFNIRHLIVAFLYTIPSIIATLMLFESPGYYIFVFGDGIEILFRNINVFILAFYLPLFLYGVGAAFRSICAQKADEFISKEDEDLIIIFCGSGVVVVLGAVAAFMGFTNRFLNATIFCITILFVFLKDKHIFSRWIGYLMPLKTSYNQNFSEDKAYKYVTSVLNLIFIFLFLLILISRGVHIDFRNIDAFSLYFPYLAEIIRNSGTQMDQNYPFVVNFFSGRGRGLYIFFSSITDEAGSQIISVMYLFVLALIGGKLTSSLFVDLKKTRYGHMAIKTAPAFTRILILFVPTVNSGIPPSFFRYHLESGTQSIFLLWIGILLMSINTSNKKNLFRLALPVAIALPVAFPQYTIFVVMLYVGMIVLSRLFNNHNCIKHLNYIMFLSIVACALSIIFNWLYVGIPEIIPYSIFEQFIIDDTWSKWIGRVGYNWFGYQFIGAEVNQDVVYVIKDYILGIGEKLKLFFRSIFYSLTSGRHLSFPIFILACLINFKSIKSTLSRFIIIFAFASSLIILGIHIYHHESFDSVSEIILPIENQVRPLKIFLDMFMLTIVMYGIVYFYSNIKIKNFRDVLNFFRLETLTTIVYYWTLSISLFLILGGGSLARLVAHSEIVPQILMIIFAVTCASFIDFVLKKSDQRLSIPWWMIVLLLTVIAYREILFQGKYSEFFNFNVFFNIVGGLTGIVMAATVFGKRYWGDFMKISTAMIFPRSSFLMKMTTLLVIFGFIIGDVVAWIVAKRGGQEVLSGLQFFMGNHGLSVTQPFHTEGCKMVDTISKILPGTEKIYFINGPASLKGCATTLLPRGKIPHHLNSYIPKYFSKIVLSSVGESAETFKNLSINYFGFILDESNITGPGFSELFDRRNLSKYFDLFYSDRQMIILTWKGNGNKKLTFDEEILISNLREKSFNDENGKPKPALLTLRKLKLKQN